MFSWVTEQYILDPDRVQFRVVHYNMKKHPFFQSLKSPHQNDEFEGKNTLSINFRARLEESDKICSFSRWIFYPTQTPKGKRVELIKIVFYGKNWCKNIPNFIFFLHFREIYYVFYQSRSVYGGFRMQHFGPGSKIGRTRSGSKTLFWVLVFFGLNIHLIFLSDGTNFRN